MYLNIKFMHVFRMGGCISRLFRFYDISDFLEESDENDVDEKIIKLTKIKVLAQQEKK